MATRTWIGGDSGSENDWSVAANWAENSVPVNGDDVVISAPPAGGTQYAISAGLNQSAVTLNSLTKDRSFEQDIGSGLTTYLQVGATTVNLERNALGLTGLNGSQTLNLDLGSATTTVVVHGSASATAANDGLPIKLLASPSTGNTAKLFLRAGRVSIAGADTESAGFDEAHVGRDGGSAADARLFLGAGQAELDLFVKAGRVYTLADLGSAELHAGELTVDGSATITTLDVYDGDAYLNASGTIATLNARGGRTDLTRSQQARTITTPKLWPGGTIVYDPGIITFSNALALQEVAEIAASAA